MVVQCSRLSERCMHVAMLHAPPSTLPAHIVLTTPALTRVSCGQPVQVGESLEARLTVERSSGSRVTFQTLCCRADSGRVLVEGAALAIMPRQLTQGAEAAAAEAAAAAARAAAAAAAAAAARGKA